MTFIIRRAEPSDWEVYRSIRLRSLSEEPDAYEAEYEAEARFEPDRWKARLATATSFLAFERSSFDWHRNRSLPATVKLLLLGCMSHQRHGSWLRSPVARRDCRPFEPSPRQALTLEVADSNSRALIRIARMDLWRPVVVACLIATPVSLRLSSRIRFLPEQATEDSR